MKALRILGCRRPSAALLPSLNPNRTRIPIDWIEDAGGTIKIQLCPAKLSKKDCARNGKQSRLQKPGDRLAGDVRAQKISVKKLTRPTFLNVARVSSKVGRETPHGGLR
jgi:hypothetical protein